MCVCATLVDTVSSFYSNANNRTTFTDFILLNVAMYSWKKIDRFQPKERKREREINDYVSKNLLSYFIFGTIQFEKKKYYFLEI